MTLMVCTTRLVAAAFLLFTSLTFTHYTRAQSADCVIDLEVAVGLIEQAQSAVDGATALRLVSEARAALQTQEAACTDFAPDNAGDSRTNPVAFGESQHVASNDYEGSITLVDYQDDGEDALMELSSRNDPAPPGTRYVLVTFDFICERPADDSCDFSRVDFSLVGDKGVSYRYDSGDDHDVSLRGLTESTEFFGGATITAVIGFVVDDDDGNFVLFTEYGDPRVFFATS